MRGLVSEQVKDRAKAQPAESRKPTKAERRDARVAAARAARCRKAFMAVGGTFVGVALMIGLAFLVFRDNGTDQIRALVMTGSAEQPTGVFRGHAGTLVITSVSDNVIRGSYQVDATGFLASDPAAENKNIRASGGFTALRN